MRCRDADDASRVRRFAMQRDHAMLEQILHARLMRCGEQRLEQTVAGGHRCSDARIGRRAGLHERPMHCRRMRFAQRRIADRLTAERIGRLIDEHDAVRDEKIERRRRVVGKCADDLPRPSSR